MSPKYSFLAAGLTALGLIGPAPRLVADPPASEPPRSSAPTMSVLLMSDGRILRGHLTEQESGDYVLRLKLGEVQVPRRQVEKTFQTIEEVYAYKRSRLPPRDPDENLKLARWCLEQGLKAEAREQLQVVLARSPNYGPAQAMLYNLDATAERSSTPRDPEVVQTGAETPAPPPPTDPALLRTARLTGIDDLPVIFDLPAPLAIKRAREFTNVVHPELQRHCASCHNERHPGSFQLIQMRGRRELSSDVLRHNLDATLRLVNPADPTRSELLSAAMMPHKPNNRPILSGPNHPTYRLLSQWVRNIAVSSPSRPEGLATELEARPVRSESFGSDRIAAPEPESPIPAELVPTPATAVRRIQDEPSVFPEHAIPAPPGRAVPGSYNGPNPYPPPETEFLTGTPIEQLQRQRLREAAAATAEPPPTPATGPPGALPPLPSSPNVPSSPPSAAQPGPQATAGASLAPSPNATSPAPAAMPGGGGPNGPLYPEFLENKSDKGETKPRSIDPALLEKILSGSR